MRIVKIGDICDVVAGQSPAGASYNHNRDGIEFHQGKKLFLGDMLQASEIFTNAPTKLAKSGDILMSVRAPVGPTVLLDREVCIGRGLAAIRARQGVDIRYLYYFLKEIEKEIQGTDGAVFPSINKSQIENLELPLPPLEKQREVVERLDSDFRRIDHARRLMNENNKRLIILKQSMLKRAFKIKG